MVNEAKDLKRRRGIYLLPNLLTTAALFSGFYAIVASMHGHFEPAAIAVFVAMLLDGLDGRVARLTHTESAFGVEYDSLSDLVSFGLAPALIMYEWALAGMASLGPAAGKLGWLAAFFYTALAALRLARFNTQIGNADRRYFVGLPSPSAAAIMVGLVWVGEDVGWEGKQLLWFAFFITIGTGALMFSNILYYSFKRFDLRGPMPLIAVVAVVLVFVITPLDPPKILFTVFLTYGLSGPVLYVLRRRQRARRQAQGLAEPESKAQDNEESRK